METLAKRHVDEQLSGDDDIDPTDENVPYKCESKKCLAGLDGIAKKLDLDDVHLDLMLSNTSEFTISDVEVSEYIDNLDDDDTDNDITSDSDDSPIERYISDDELFVLDAENDLVMQLCGPEGESSVSQERNEEDEEDELITDFYKSVADMGQFSTELQQVRKEVSETVSETTKTVSKLQQTVDEEIPEKFSIVCKAIFAAAKQIEKIAEKQNQLEQFYIDLAKEPEKKTSKKRKAVQEDKASEAKETNRKPKRGRK